MCVLEQWDGYLVWAAKRPPEHSANRIIRNVWIAGMNNSWPVHIVVVSGSSYGLAYSVVCRVGGDDDSWERVIMVWPCNKAFGRVSRRRAGRRRQIPRIEEGIPAREMN